MDCEGGERHRLASCEPNYLSLLFTQWMFVGATEGRQGSVCVWSGGGVCVSLHMQAHTLGWLCLWSLTAFCKYTQCACFNFFFGMQDFLLGSHFFHISVLMDGDVSWWMFSAGFGFTKLSAMTWTGSCLCLYLRTDVWRQFALCVNWQFDGGSRRVSQRWCYCMTNCRQVQTTVGSALCT